MRRMGLGIVRSCCRLLPADAFAQTQVLAELAASDDVHQGAECGVAVGRTWTSGEFGRAWTPMLEVPAARDLTAGPSLRVGLAPQVQVSPCRTTMMAHAYCEGNAMDSPEVPASAEGQVRRVAARARRGGALRQAPLTPNQRCCPEGAMPGRDCLTRPTDAAPLALFRIVFGILMLAEVLRYWAYGRIERYYVDPDFLFPFVEGIRPIGDGMYAVFVVMGIAALLLCVGYHYRTAAVAFFTLYTYTFLLDRAQYNNHYYLICLLGFLFVMTDAHRAFSVDARRRALAGCVPAWHVLVFRLQICIVFVYAGIAKLNPDWLAGQPVRMWLAARSDYPVIGPLLLQEWFVYLYAYAGLLFDLLICFLLLWAPARSVGFVLLVCFNLLNRWFYDIGIFPYLTVATFALFMDAVTIRSVFARLPGSDFGRRAAALFRVGLLSPAWARARVCLMVVFVLTQVLIPLRHFIIPGDVSWTDEGHNFSWRMKLRDKRAREITFYTRDPRTGHVRELSTAELTRRQKRKMSTRPHMVVRYARHLAEGLERDGFESPAVHVRALVALNGREPRSLIDEDANLAAEDYKLLTHNDWITPMRDPAVGSQLGARKAPVGY